MNSSALVPTYFSGPPTDEIDTLFIIEETFLRKGAVEQRRRSRGFSPAGTAGTRARGELHEEST